MSQSSPSVTYLSKFHLPHSINHQVLQHYYLNSILPTIYHPYHHFFWVSAIAFYLIYHIKLFSRWLSENSWKGNLKPLSLWKILIDIRINTKIKLYTMPFRILGWSGSSLTCPCFSLSSAEPPLPSSYPLDSLGSFPSQVLFHGLFPTAQRIFTKTAVSINSSWNSSWNLNLDGLPIVCS